MGKGIINYDAATTNELLAYVQEIKEGGGINPDAPKDGNLYGQKDGEWAKAQEQLESGKNIKTLNGVSVLGEGNIDVAPTIGENGNWFINGEDTGKPANGKDGADGVSLGEIALVQETGTGTGSENKVMSQSAVTKELTELETYKTPVSHGNKYIKEIYLSGDFDKTHTYVLSRIARNNTTYKWAIYIKDLDTSIEYYLGFNAFTEEPKFIDSMKLYKTSGSGSYYITAIINWEIIDEGISLQNLELPLSNIFSLEKNPFINSNINMSEIKDDIDAIEAEINGELDESVEKSSELDLEKTFSIEFAPVLPTMSNK